MLERIVENWLTSASERTFEVPFAQVLASEGHQILQGPVHHAFEHGKDLITVSNDGELCAYQLKNGGGQLGVEELRRYQGQLTTLSRSAVSIPSISEPRQPDRVFFVTNRTLTPVARDLIRQLSDSNRSQDYPAIELIEKDSLLGRFTEAHGEFFPVEPEDISSFLELFLARGEGEFPAETFVTFLEQILPFDGSDPSNVKCERSAAASALFTAYVLTPWTRKQNHLEIARGWLLLSTQILRLAAKHDLEDEVFETSYSLSYQAVRLSLHALLEEAVDRDDLVIPGMTESLVYGFRALRVCAACSALLLSEKLGGHDHSLKGPVQELLARELPYIRTLAEAGVPLVFLVAWALNELGEYLFPVFLITEVAKELLEANHPNSEHGLPDPYHSLREVQLAHLTRDHTFLDEEDFSGKSYMVHVAIEWLARRLWKRHVETLWPDATRIQQMEHWPQIPEGFFRYRDPNAQLQVGQFPAPTSWSELSRASSRTNRNNIPELLLSRPELMPLVPLVFPHRFTSSYAGALDHLITGAGELVEPEPGEETDAADAGSSGGSRGESDPSTDPAGEVK